MSDHPEHAPNDTQPAHLALFVLGGLCVGAGIINLYWSFGAPTGPLNSDYAAVGFTGLDNLMSLDASDYSIPMLVIGIVCLVYGNSSAWRYTGGY